MPTNSANVTTQMAIGAPLAVILVWGLGTFGGVMVPPEVAAAFAALFTAIFGAFAPSSKS